MTRNLKNEIYELFCEFQKNQRVNNQAKLTDCITCRLTLLQSIIVKII